MQLTGVFTQEVNRRGLGKTLLSNDLTIEGIDEIDIFKKLAKKQCFWYRSTNNGRVPSFKFNDEEYNIKFKNWDKARSESEKIDEFYGNGIVD